MINDHCAKSVHIQSILIRIFPGFSCIRTEYGGRYPVSLRLVRMPKNVGKMRIRITPNTDTFYVDLHPSRHLLAQSQQ